MLDITVAWCMVNSRTAAAVAAEAAEDEGDTVILIPTELLVTVQFTIEMQDASLTHRCGVLCWFLRYSSKYLTKSETPKLKIKFYYCIVLFIVPERFRSSPVYQTIDSSIPAIRVKHIRNCLSLSIYYPKLKTQLSETISLYPSTLAVFKE